MRVLVLDIFSRIGLAVTNPLAGEHVIVGGALGDRARRAERLLCSPKVSEVHRHPSPIRDPAGFDEAILRICERARVEAVFPASTASAFALSRLRARLGESPVVFVVEELERLELLADKWKLYELCVELGIDAPPTVLPMGEGVAAARAMELPVIAKPRAAEASRGVLFVRTADELEDLLAHPRAVGTQLAPGEFPLILQEVLAGELHDAKGCAVEGRTVAMLTGRRLLTRHEFGGNGLVHEATHEPALAALGSSLMARLGWNGPLDLECLLTADGRYVVLDANTRVWGSVHLSVLLGQNIPAMALDVFARGETSPVTGTYPGGAVLRWRTLGSVSRCFREPRSPRAVARRLNLLVGPRRHAYSDVCWGNYRHLGGLMLENATRRRRAAGPPSGPGAAGTGGRAGR